MKNLIIAITAILTLTVTSSNAQSLNEFFTKTDAFLSTYVSNGSVDYKGIKSNVGELNDILEIAKNISVTTSQPKEYQAFWINAYNLSVIKGIIDNYGIKSPLDKKGFFDKTKYDLGGTAITLNDIEHKNLRPKFNDARFHFVLVCGAKGCPPLIAKAYTPANLENLLEQQTIKALNDSSFIRVSGKKVAFSEIFKWYKEDFVTKSSNEIDYLNKYRKEKVPANAKVTYYSYDWRINSK
ncbi:DUF547 domain-containing protein [Aureisphaera galaxeae]|uniref:DUF547 domain-containing protein n=1 Tax=Aureisphaera galaxeae TaxID=1538023 RepID=UPI0023502B56|nr:DUF547 domain-containing protein [Aureisphaera galaxeae]MDC8002961.1 DUF547 domain-containing protein [Aureisphaera galaxeae]